ncbi:VWA domain-containing protein [Bradyrhizobium sp. Leo170]|uniref:VWA domain-containing protein n=1 Tax=Bradyrhizobium sp. Leo170 TaxID=1571199 RepID=UPI00102EC36A|nr:VWA domain-containing protein [Bradyrhizobium sp. Leo170]TAI67627.1 hypothetical protein CWO89_02080 [Bradyrhizobium sp. Leo170]
MPRLDGTDVETHTVGSNFSFTGARIEGLGATEYTLVDIEVDMSGSVSSFRPDLIAAVKTAVDACGKSPRSDNLLIRVAAFSTMYPKGVNEVHGFIPLTNIDVASYDTLQPGGGTPLFDACYSGIGASNAYAKMLYDQEFNANAISFFITDGEDTHSAMRPAQIRAEVELAQREEYLESHVSVLIGINASSCSGALRDFQREAGITQYIDAGDATKGKLAKLAQFVSQSISSTSQALGTGGPSQSIAPTI